MIPTPPPKALLPLSTTINSIPSHRNSNPFETPEIQISRPASPIILPTELDFHNNHHHNVYSSNNSDIESGKNSRSNSIDRSRSRSRGTSTSRDPLNRKNNKNNFGIWSQLKSILPFTTTSSNGNEVVEEELDEIPRGRTNYLGGIDLTLGTIRTSEVVQVNDVTGGGAGKNKRRRIGGIKVMSKNKAELTISFALIALVGMNDSATGANLASMQAHYNVSYDQISIVFLSNVAGYFISCVSSSFLTHHLGLQRSLLLACFILSLGCLILAIAPPFPIFTSALSLLGFGSGLFDSCLTTVISYDEDPAIMSFMYACFGVGAMISPLVIGAFVDQGIDWNLYYWLPFGLVIILTYFAYFIFANYKPPQDEPHHHLLPSPSPTTTTPATFPSSSSSNLNGIPLVPTISNQTTMSSKISHGLTSGGGNNVPNVGIRERMTRALKMRAVWAGFLLIVIAFGTSDTLSAWMVSYMVDKRQAPQAGSRYMLTGLWGGIAIGRVALTFLAKKLGERTFSILMLVAASVFLSVVWGVSNVTVDALSLVMVGFFIGPVTPRVLSMVSARVPPSLKSSVMSLTIGLGLIGSSVGPLAFGVLAGRGGLASLPAVLIGASCTAALGWMLVPKKIRRED